MLEWLFISLALVFAFAEVRGLLLFPVGLRAKARAIEGGARLFRPLCSSANALQRRLFQLCDTEGYIEKACSDNEDETEDVVTYTCYVLAKYLASLRLFAMGFEEGGPRLLGLGKKIPAIPGVDECLKNGKFDLSLAFQVSMSEMMIVKEGTSLNTMGYVQFRAKLAEDSEFYRVFGPIRKGLQLIAEAKLKGEEAPDHQLRRLQHGLLWSLEELDPQFGTIAEFNRVACKPATTCLCDVKACKDAKASRYSYSME